LWLASEAHSACLAQSSGLANGVLDNYLTIVSKRTTPKSLARFVVTPRFEIFYALRAVSLEGEATTDWARKTRRQVPADFMNDLRVVAPRPIQWALLADSIRDAKVDPETVPQLLDDINSLRHRDFQKAILEGVFRRTETAATLIAGEQSLAEAVRIEAEGNSALLGLIGLHPFDLEGAVAATFNRLISDPASYRADLVRTLDIFWRSSFADTWKLLEPRMQKIVEAMQGSLAAGKLSVFGREHGLPVAFDDRKKLVTSRRGAALFPYESVRAIHIMPSAFNDARLWAAYKDRPGAVRLYFPVFNAGLLTPQREVGDAAAGFRALGDTTRFAMAGILARQPQTSVELAKVFGVSKPTISHHVQLLRAAGLLDERATENGIVLTLNRDALERISTAAAEEMFGEGDAPMIRRSRRETRGRDEEFTNENSGNV
jgi:ArsR family transcriptional regulator